MANLSAKQTILSALLHLAVCCGLNANALVSSTGTLHSAVIPQFHHSKAAIQFSYFATLINDSEVTAENCRIELDKHLPAKFRFWATQATDNSPAGEDNAPIDIGVGKAQTFGFSLTFYRKLLAEDQTIYPRFLCDNLAAAPQIAGTNSLEFASFSTENVRWLTADEVEELSHPEVDFSERVKSLADLTPEQPRINILHLWGLLRTLLLERLSRLTG